MSEFKPGDRVTSVGGNLSGTIAASDEGWWQVRWDHGHVSTHRPSELTPADPVPDAAVMLVRELVRELVAAEIDWNQQAEVVAKGARDEDPVSIAFAKYIRANSLTVERVREAARTVLRYRISNAEIKLLHAALTE